LADLPVTLCYHNHRHEVEGDLERTAVLVDAMRSDRLGLAVDFGWVLQAGTDPARVVAQFRDRIRYVHIKDARNGQWTELGRGQLPIAQVFSAIVPLNLPWWTAEQDTTERTAQDSARENYQVLRQQLEQG
jgi:sugar phosphate isomerase/epimerase